jgi:Ras-specific guanine nucleotide-releasing factor 1
MFIDITVISAPSSPSNLSNVTLVGSNNSEMSPQDTETPQTEPETETETETDSETKQQQDTPTESKEPEMISLVTKESSEEQTKPSSISVQFKSEEKRASVPILESERRLSRSQIKRKGSEGQARRDGYEEEKGKPDEFQFSDESSSEGPLQPVTHEQRASTSSRSASITTTNVIQVKAE